MSASVETAVIVHIEPVVHFTSSGAVQVCKHKTVRLPVAPSVGDLITVDEDGTQASVVQVVEPLNPADDSIGVVVAHPDHVA